MPTALKTTLEKKRLVDGAQLAPFTRDLAITRAAGDGATAVPGLDLEKRTLSFTFSSEQPVSRWFGNEVLSHDAGAADLSRLNDSAPLLFNHDYDDVIGVCERAWINGDRKGECTVRFAKTARGDEVMGMVADDILRNVSFMYQALAYRIESDEEDPYYDDDAIYTATKWLAYEVSIVSVPADQTVGIGRSLATQERSVHVETRAPAKPSGAAAAEPQPQKGTKAMDEATLAAEKAATEHLRKSIDDAKKDERDRVESIVALGRMHKLDFEVVSGMVTRGLDIAAARGEVLDGILKKGASPVASLGHQANPDLSDKDKRSYSFVRAVAAAFANDWKAAGFEREVSEEIAKLNQRQATTGFYIPTNLPFAPDEKHLRAWQAMDSRPDRRQTRAPYLVGTAVQGGNLVQTQLLYENFIEVLRNMMVTPMLGARFLTGLTGNIDIPRQTAQTGTFWVGESGALTESEATFDKVQLRPKTIGALSKMSRLMLLQATPAIEMIAREDLLQVMARGIDLSAISGSGASNQPTGIVNQAGVGSVVGGTNGLALSFDHLISLKYAVKVANAPQSALGFAINSKSVGFLSTLKATTGQYLWEPQGGLVNASPDTVKGSRYAESQQLRSTLTKGTASGICSELVYGNWQELLIAEWGVTEILVNPYDATGFTTGDVLIRALQTMDIGVRHGGSFSVMSDALTPGF